MKRSRLNKSSKAELPKLKKELDRLASQQARQRDSYICKRCGVVHKAVHAAHIFSRSNLATRWDLENIITLCYFCHIMWSHRQPLEFAEWIKEKIGVKKYNKLRKKSQSVYQFRKEDYEKWLEYLFNKKEKPI